MLSFPRHTQDYQWKTGETLYQISCSVCYFHHVNIITYLFSTTAQTIVRKEKCGTSLKLLTVKNHTRKCQLRRLERERLPSFSFHCRRRIQRLQNSGRCDHLKKIALDEYMLFVLITEFYWRCHFFFYNVLKYLDRDIQKFCLFCANHTGISMTHLHFYITSPLGPPNNHKYFKWSHFSFSPSINLLIQQNLVALYKVHLLIIPT